MIFDAADSPTGCFLAIYPSTTIVTSGWEGPAWLDASIKGGVTSARHDRWHVRGEWRLDAHLDGRGDGRDRRRQRREVHAGRRDGAGEPRGDERASRRRRPRRGRRASTSGSATAPGATGTGPPGPPASRRSSRWRRSGHSGSRSRAPRPTVRLGYQRAARLGAWTIEGGWISAAVEDVDGFRITQSPLTLEIQYAGRGARRIGALADVTVSGGRLTGRLSKP